MEDPDKIAELFLLDENVGDSEHLIEDPDKNAESLLLQEDLNDSVLKMEDLDKEKESLLLQEEVNQSAHQTDVASGNEFPEGGDTTVNALSSKAGMVEAVNDGVETVGETSLSAGADDASGESQQAEDTLPESAEGPNQLGETMECDKMLDDSMMLDGANDAIGETGFSIEAGKTLDETMFTEEAKDAVDASSSNMEADKTLDETMFTEEAKDVVDVPSLNMEADKTLHETMFTEEAKDVVDVPSLNMEADKTLDETMYNEETKDYAVEKVLIEEDSDAVTETSLKMKDDEVSGECGLIEEADNIDSACVADDVASGIGDAVIGEIKDDGEQPDSILGNNYEDIPMGDITGEDSKNNNNAAISENFNVTTADEIEQELSEALGEALPDSEDLASNEFINQSETFAVQSEPPQQLMEEADAPEDVAVPNDEINADLHNDLVGTLVNAEEGEMFLGKENETTSLHEEAAEEGQGDMGELPHDQIGPSDEAKEGTVAHLDDQEEYQDEAMDLPLGDATNQELGSELKQLNLSEFNGRLILGSDGTVRLLSDQDNLQGIQLMEEDDKPEGEGDTAQQDIAAELHEALLKQEEIKKEEEEEKISDAPLEGQSANAETDPLTTLASAALDHQAPANGVKAETDTTEMKTDPENLEPQWMDVGICKGTHCIVRTYYIPSGEQTWDTNWNGITTSTLPDHRALAKLELEAGKAYKFRVAAINSCGRGPWSEISAFRTSMPGVPGAPSSIKISKTVDGARVTWEPPSSASGVIEDYIVYMAIKVASTDSSLAPPSGPAQLSFIRIYQGSENQCSVSNDTLSDAHIDVTTKPAILFRIAARNDKGLGPAIQVRWLQDVAAPNSAKAPVATRRPGPEVISHLPMKRNKSDFE